MISVVNGVVVRVMDASSCSVEVKPICPYCGQAEQSSWNHEHCFAPLPNRYGYVKTHNHMCSNCRKSFQIQLYNYS